MKQKPRFRSRRKRSSTKSVLRLPDLTCPDLEHAKSAVLNSLNSTDAKQGFRHAIDEFGNWYCSEPRLAFDRIVVLRYRSHLEFRQLAPGTTLKYSRANSYSPLQSSTGHLKPAFRPTLIVQFTARYGTFDFLFGGSSGGVGLSISGFASCSAVTQKFQTLLKWHLLSL